jgi:hypothetical protein
MRAVLAIVSAVVFLMASELFAGDSVQKAGPLQKAVQKEVPIQKGAVFVAPQACCGPDWGWEVHECDVLVYCLRCKYGESVPRCLGWRIKACCLMHRHYQKHHGCE